MQEFEKHKELASIIEWFANNVPCPGTPWNKLLHEINTALALPDEQGDAIPADLEQRAKELYPDIDQKVFHSCNAGLGWERLLAEAIHKRLAERAAYLAGAQSVGADKLAAWNMALILANNECVRMSDDYNKDDEIDRASAASDCAKIIRGYINNPIPELATLLSPSQPGSQEGEEKDKIDRWKALTENYYTTEEVKNFISWCCHLAWYDNDTSLWNTLDESLDPFRYTTEEMMKEYVDCNKDSEQFEKKHTI